MPHFVKDIEEIQKRARQKIEDGAVTSSYALDKDKVVEILNEALATEIVCVLRYMHHYFMATGVHGKTAAAEFKEHADQEREHADELAERIQQLGGKPDFNPKSLLERSVSHYVEGESLADMIREDLVAERVVIDVYREMIRYFGDKDSTTRKLIEHLLAEEEEHASDLSDLMYIVNPSTGETEMQDPGTEIGENDEEETMDRGNGQKQQRNANGKNQNDGSPRRQPEPAHEPGTTGRVMARRGRNDLEPAKDDVALGGQSGSSRSVKITNKNRKNNAA
ncbi:MAG TPA: ferritin-like domain-containing protein [Polyangiaceae bacterium]|jgi:bacterioferritin|nr:ferritin-like domain-containing protein [Polyangiaceae bacterium]